MKHSLTIQMVRSDDGTLVAYRPSCSCGWKLKGILASEYPTALSWGQAHALEVIAGRLFSDSTIEFNPKILEIKGDEQP